MKMIFRADDVGYTDVCNIGTFRTMEEGVVTAADVMLDSPGTVDALQRLKNMPWISVGWHAHFWGSPVLDPSEVPTLVADHGNRFRTDLIWADDINEEELMRECRAQMDRCISILGRVPDTGNSGGKDDSIVQKVYRKICREYGIPCEFATKYMNDGSVSYPDQRWANRKIYVLRAKEAYQDVETDSLSKFESYNPVRYYTEDICDLGRFSNDCIISQSWHPGYLDYYVYREGDSGVYAKYYTSARLVDVQALCSEELKSWIKRNNIELVNFKDALYGTNDYQNHLRNMQSELYCQK